MLPVLSWAQPPSDRNEKALMYNKEAVLLLNTYHYDECRVQLKLAQEQMENNISYYLAARMNNMECKYDSAILNATKALEMEPNFKAPYTELFKAYYGQGKWEKALEVSENVPQSEPDGNISSQLSFIAIALGIKGISDVLVPLLLLVLAAAFFMPLYAGGKQKNTTLNPADPIRTTEVILVASAVSCILWSIFYLMSRWIWSHNPHVDPYKFTLPLQIFIFERDGIESFCLYALMFGNLVLSASLAPMLLKFRSKSTIYLSLTVAMLCIAAYYYYSVRYIPPLAIRSAENSMLLAVMMAIFGVGFCFLYQKQRLITMLIIVFLIVCLHLVTAYPPSLFDLSYIVDPALRLMAGFKVSETYAQYDLFLTYLAMMCVKFNIPIELFPYFGQLSYMALFVCIFLFSESFFRHKWLSIPFIIVLVSVRNYGIWDAGVSIFQVSPLRIDLWLIVLFIAYKKGAQHWLLGLAIGLLVIFHRNLGLLYMGAYLQLLIALFIIELAPLIQERRLTMGNIMSVAMQQMRRYAINLGMIAVAVILCFVVFGGLFSSTAIEYQKYGVGMLPISRVSFYWYVPVILSSAMLLLVYNRVKLEARYVAAGIFVVFLAIANSMYFFGRSHENTILIVSTLFVLALFIILDIMLVGAPEVIVTPVPSPKPAPQVKNNKAAAVAAAPVNEPASAPFFTRRRLIIFLPFLLIGMTDYYYSDRLVGKTAAQYNNFQEHQFYYPIPSDLADTVSIRALTHNSEKVYFIDFKFDFPFYYFGHYTPVANYNPSTAWIFNEDMIKFMQGLIDKGYYIVFQTSKQGGFEAILPNLMYDHVAERENITVLSKTNNPTTLPKSPGTVYHMAFKDTLPVNGAAHMMPNLDNNFSIELLVRPAAVQGQDAAVFNNISQNYYVKGIGLQYNNKPGEYVIAVCNGDKQTPKIATFMLDDQWHYLCVNVQNDTLKLFDNGKKIIAEPIGGTLMQNSDMAMYFGNVIGHNRPFKGNIREIKVSNGTVNEEDVARTAAQLGNIQ